MIMDLIINNIINSMLRFFILFITNTFFGPIIKHNHLLPKLPNYMDPPICPTSTTSNVCGFYVQKRLGISPHINHCINIVSSYPEYNLVYWNPINNHCDTITSFKLLTILKNSTCPELCQLSRAHS